MRKINKVRYLIVCEIIRKGYKIYEILIEIFFLINFKRLKYMYLIDKNKLMIVLYFFFFVSRLW